MKRDPVSEAARLIGSRGGKKGGRKGGKKRMAALTPEQRKELARKAARARWDRRKRKKTD